ncbi:MBL fold metallo-hydrolase [candidate division WOR-3 bacterium]|nr:MBL fold metallo-hydrolase [candidate division WOR-3 bacterium]
MNYEMINISDSVTTIVQHVIPGCPTNCYVLKTEKNNYIIDTGFGSESANILSGCTDKSKPVTVLNTHYHWDHIWGNYEFYDNDIIAHEKILKNIDEKYEGMLETNRRFVCGRTEKKSPDVLFDSELRLIKDGVLMFYSPGHTNDGISVYFEKEKILFVGDNIGDDDENIVPDLETGIEEYMGALEKYLSLKPELILSGHNVPRKMDFIERIIKRLLN